MNSLDREKYAQRRRKRISNREASELDMRLNAEAQDVSS